MILQKNAIFTTFELNVSHYGTWTLISFGEENPVKLNTSEGV
jgi:hypothetical protein